MALDIKIMLTRHVNVNASPTYQNNASHTEVQIAGMGYQKYEIIHRLRIADHAQMAVGDEIAVSFTFSVAGGQAGGNGRIEVRNTATGAVYFARNMGADSSNQDWLESFTFELQAAEVDIVLIGTFNNTTTFTPTSTDTWYTNNLVTSNWRIDWINRNVDVVQNSSDTEFWTKERYRYGFNGMERDDEWSGSGNHYTTYFRPYDPRLGRWMKPDPIHHAWMSPYNSMDNNPIVFTDPDGDKIKGTREERKAFKEQSKADGTWGGKDGYRRMYRGNKRHLILNATDRVDESIATAEISSTPLNHDKDVASNVDWFYWNPGASGDETSSGGDRDNIDPMPRRPVGPVNQLSPPRGLVTRPALSNPPPPANTRFNMGTPFNGNASTFSNPTVSNQQLQQIATNFLNSGATQINVNISTNLSQAQINNALSNGMTLRQLMWQRGTAIQQNLINMGVPIQAFPNSWLRFQYNSSPGVNVQTR